MDFTRGGDCQGSYGPINKNEPSVVAFDSGQRQASPPWEESTFPPLNVRLDIPYPEVHIHCPNTGYARILQNAYCGNISEFTAISQYFYQHVLQETLCPEAAQVLMGVSMVEMKHLGLLAHCIHQLGGNPILAVPTKGQRLWWSGSAVCYQRGLRMMLLEDIESERAAIREYRRAVDAISNEEVQALISRIIMDEEHHIRLFCTLLERYCDFHR